jgi:hypothetical protein
MKVTFGRKFYAGLFALIVLVYFFTMVIYRFPEVLTPLVIVIYAVLVVTICFMYIGGNVWKAWIKSKYFKAELHEIPPGI